MLTGTLWRMKPGAPAIWGSITDRPGAQADVINNSVNMVGVIKPGDVILVVSERQKFSHWSPHIESLQIATPVPGWCNAAYFTSESIWLERIA